MTNKISRIKCLRTPSEEELLSATNNQVGTYKYKIENVKLEDVDLEIVSLYDFNSNRKFLMKCSSCGEYSSQQIKVRINGFCKCKVRKQEDEIKNEFLSKNMKCVHNNKYCTYCESYRPDSYFGNGKIKTCKLCQYVSTYKIKVGFSFEEIMEQWDETVKGEDYVKLPYLKGNSTKGYIVASYSKVDKSIYNEASKIMWIYANGYVKASMSKDNLNRLSDKDLCYFPNRKCIHLHRVVLGIQDISHKKLHGDHINGDKSDNRLQNLRIASPTENCHNSKISSLNKVGYIGVEYLEGNGINKYRARLYRGKVNVLRKCYPTAEDAALAYDHVLRTEYNSEFNVYNFPLEGEKGKE